MLMCRIDDNGVDPIHSREQHRTADKPRPCSECRRTIEPGETYEWATWHAEDWGRAGNPYWQTCSTCEHCWVGRLCLVAVCGGFLRGEILEELEEHWDEEYQLRCHDLGRFILNARRQWHKADGTLVPVPTPIRVPAALRGIS